LDGWHSSLSGAGDEQFASRNLGEFRKRNRKHFIAARAHQRRGVLSDSRTVTEARFVRAGIEACDQAFPYCEIVNISSPEFGNCKRLRGSQLQVDQRTIFSLRKYFLKESPVVTVLML
jgi:hypothetical protein